MHACTHVGPSTKDLQAPVLVPLIKERCQVLQSHIPRFLHCDCEAIVARIARVCRYEQNVKALAGAFGTEMTKGMGRSGRCGKC
jgi:hypothetical protein